MTRSPLSSSFLLPRLPNLVKGVNGKSKERVIRKHGVGFMGCLNGGVKVIQRQHPKAQRSGQAFDPCPTEASGFAIIIPLRSGGVISLPVEIP